MPFDGNPAKFTETKPDVFSLEGLIAWLEKQPSRQKYDYFACDGTCLLDQYLAAHGLPAPGPLRPEYNQLTMICGRNRAGDGKLEAFVAAGEPYTFGGALTRARKLLAKRQP